MKCLVETLESLADVDKMETNQNRSCYCVLLQFPDEAFGFGFMSRDEEPFFISRRLEPCLISQLEQDAISRTCIEVAQEFRDVRTASKKLAELRFTTDLVNRAHNSEGHLSALTDRLKEAMDELSDDDTAAPLLEEKINQALENAYVAYDSLHAMYILSKYMRSEDVEKFVIRKKVALKDLLDNLRHDTTLKARAQLYVSSFSVKSCSEELAIYCDRGLMYELLFCIVDNAIIQGSQGKEHTGIAVNVAAHQTKTETDCFAVVEVSDTGHGIEPEIVQAINRYFNEQQDSMAPVSAGYGLLMAKCVAAVHYAEIELESEPKHGTRITITAKCC